MHFLILIPFILQAVLIAADEIFFHLKRGLPRFERIGHPVDTLAVLTCFLFVIFVPFSTAMLKVYVGLSLFSCLMVTKDEFVHKHHCPAAEHWLHALLFINHPCVLASNGLIWTAMSASPPPEWLANWLQCQSWFGLFLLSQAVFISLFLFYQVIYWNFVWKKR